MKHHALCLLVCFLMMQPAHALEFNFGDIGKTFDTLGKLKDATVDIDEPEEIELGGNIASNLLGAAPLLDNPPLQQYINQVGLWLALQTERPDLPWHFAVLDDSNINAFATPGGNIFITRGLLQRMQNEAELAGVLAHEIAHVLKKHHLEAVKKRARTSLLADLAVAAADRKGRHPALGQLAGVGSELYALGLDKEDEFEADRMGVVIAARAGYDPYGLPVVLQILESVNPEDSDFALMFKTHPTPTLRLNRLDALMAQTLDGSAERPILSGRFYAALGRVPSVPEQPPLVPPPAVVAPVPPTPSVPPPVTPTPTASAVPAAPPAPLVSREQQLQADWERQQEAAWAQRVKELQGRQPPLEEPLPRLRPGAPVQDKPPLANTPQSVATPKPVIRALKASYDPLVNSANIGKAAGNGTTALAAACNGKTSCAYRIDAAVIGDPAPGKPKAYAAQWQCGDTLWTASVEAEANGYVLDVSCQ